MQVSMVLLEHFIARNTSYNPVRTQFDIDFGAAAASGKTTELQSFSEWRLDPLLDHACHGAGVLIDVECHALVLKLRFKLDQSLVPDPQDDLRRAAFEPNHRIRAVPELASCS